LQTKESILDLLGRAYERTTILRTSVTIYASTQRNGYCDWNLSDNTRFDTIQR